MKHGAREVGVVGRDGKKYPGRWLNAEDREFIFGRTHYLHHDENMTVREIQDYWLYHHGIRRSVGSIASYLARKCSACSGVQTCPPEQTGGRS